MSSRSTLAAPSVYAFVWERLVAWGVSLTGVTVTDAVSVAAEKAVVPPFVAVLASAPLLPLGWSQARRVRSVETVPLKPSLGWKQRRVAASAASRWALASETAPSGCQVAPLSVE